MNNKIISSDKFWNYFIKIMIFISISLLMFYEISILFLFDAYIRESIVLVLLLFDVLFLVEFIIKLVNSIVKKKFVDYLKSFLFVDVLSLFIIIFASIPLFLSIMKLDISFLDGFYENMSKIFLINKTNIINIILILRLIRIIKLFNIINKKKLLLFIISITALFTIFLLFYYIDITNNKVSEKKFYQTLLRQTYQYISISDELDLGYDTINNYTKEYLIELFAQSDDVAFIELNNIKNINKDWGNSNIIFSRYSEHFVRNKLLDNNLYHVEFLNLRIVLTNIKEKQTESMIKVLILSITIIFTLSTIIVKKE